MSKMSNKRSYPESGYLKYLCVGLLFVSITFVSCDSPMDSDIKPNEIQEATTPGHGSIEQSSVPDRYIVGLKPGKANIAHEAADDVYLEFDFGDIGTAVSGRFPEAAREALQNNPNVRYIEAEGVMQAHDWVDEDEGNPNNEQVLPWGIDRVDADVVIEQGETGEGAKITIIDSGIDPNHETLADNVAGGRAWASCRGGQCAEPWDDDNNHGTHVAGTAGAVNNHIGVVGVATEPELYAAKVLDSRGSGSFSDVAAAIEWAANEGHDVANLSLGGGASDVVEDAVKYANANGVLLIASAGNSGPGENTVNYPAAYDEVMAVSATDQNDDIANFSSRGSEVEITAPGVDILSSIPGDNYDAYNGTSMSAPHVAGGGALLMSSLGMSNDEARSHLKDTAEDIGLDDTEQGAGLMNIAAALAIEEDDGNGEEEPIELTVETGEATNIGDNSATLTGELIELENADEANVYFEWGEQGNLSNSTSTQTLSATGSFDEFVSGLSSGTDYEFRAVAEANGETDTGAVMSFTTEEEEDDNGDTDPSAPVIEFFEVTDASNPRWGRVEVDWTVSDEGGNLDQVETVMVLDGQVLDTETTSVSGSTASGEHEHRERDGHGETYDITITVTDTDGNSNSETQSIDL